MKGIRVGLCGIGGYAQTYLRQLLDSGCEGHLVGVVDPYAVQSPMYEAVRQREIPIYETLEAFYREKQADLMVIATPISLHAKQCITAVKCGSHVLCEKPTAATYAQVQQMLAAQRKTGKRIFIGFQHSFLDSFLELKADAAAGKYGRLRCAKTLVLWPRDFAYYARGGGWAGRIRDQNGTCVFDSVTSNATAHYLHNLLYLTGEQWGKSAMPEEITVECMKANDIESFDTCVLRGVLPGGASLVYVVSHATQGKQDPIFQLEFDNAVVSYDPEAMQPFVARLADGTYKKYALPEYGDQTPQKLQKVMDWVQDPTKPLPPCDIETTLPFMRLVTAIFANADMPRFAAVYRDDDRVYVEGLDADLRQCYQNNKLLGEICPQYQTKPVTISF